MATFKPGDVVKVPFPYTDRPTRKYRPALVISVEKLQSLHSLVWVLMITSAANRGWPGDVVIDNLKRAGLPVASLVRTAKIATIDAGDATRLGAIPTATLRTVRRKLGKTLDMLEKSEITVPGKPS